MEFPRTLLHLFYLTHLPPFAELPYLNIKSYLSKVLEGLSPSFLMW